jgi:hypothetical protein
MEMALVHFPLNKASATTFSFPLTHCMSKQNSWNNYATTLPTIQCWLCGQEF